jgi:hypothetical protein
VSGDDDLLGTFFGWLADVMQGAHRQAVYAVANTQAMTAKSRLPAVRVPQQPGPAITPTPAMSAACRA